MKICTNCNKEVPNDALFCTVCGTKLADFAGEASRPADNVPTAPADEPAAFTEVVTPEANAPVSPAAGYNAAAAAVPPQSAAGTDIAPKITHRYSFAKYFFLGIITFGIYDLVMMIRLVKDVNTIVSPFDGKKSTGYGVMFFIASWATLGIGPLVWGHNLAKRISRFLAAAGVKSPVKVWKFWIFSVLLAETGIFPLIYIASLIKSVNLLIKSYNNL